MTDDLSVIYEDKNFLALYKPAGVLVHGTKSSKSKAQSSKPTGLTLVDWLLKRYPEIASVGDDTEIRPGIVHRLDKDTSGIMVVPRNQDYFEYLKKLFQNHQVEKNYLALVYGKLTSTSGKIEKPIRLKPGSVKRTVWSGKMEKPAVTEYRVVKYFPAGFSLLEVMPETGRTHQIRVHLAAIHHPVVGDVLYGPKNPPFNLHRQFLHAASLEWTSEDGKRIKIEAELPEELQKVIQNLKLKNQN